MADTTILIQNPDVVRDIQTLAERAGKPATDVVADLVRARMAAPSKRTPQEIEERRRKVEKVLAEYRSLPHDGVPLTDADLYDEDGLPR